MFNYVKNAKTLWDLRNEIVLNSLYVVGYENSFYLTKESVCNFFDSYVNYLEEECGGIDNDSKENLWNWYNCYDEFPFEWDYYAMCEAMNDISNVEYWIEDDRFFVCNDTENMDNIDEISKEEFIKRFVSLAR